MHGFLNIICHYENSNLKSSVDITTYLPEWLNLKIALMELYKKELYLSMNYEHIIRIPFDLARCVTGLFTPSFLVVLCHYVYTTDHSLGVLLSPFKLRIGILLLFISLSASLFKI